MLCSNATNKNGGSGRHTHCHLLNCCNIRSFPELPSYIVTLSITLPWHLTGEGRRNLCRIWLGWVGQTRLQNADKLGIHLTQGKLRNWDSIRTKGAGRSELDWPGLHTPFPERLTGTGVGEIGLAVAPLPPWQGLQKA